MKPRVSTVHFARNGAIRHMTISFDESPLQVHIRLNKYGITNYKSTPAPKMGLTMDDPCRTNAIKDALALAFAMTGMGFAKSPMSLA